MRSASTLLAVVGMLALVGPPAQSAFIVTQNSNEGQLLNNLIGGTNGLSGFSVTRIGNNNAFGTFTGGGPAFGIDSGVVLSTGRVVDLHGPNNSGATSTDFGASGPSGDDIQLRIRFTAAAGADKLFFKFVFGSEEFKEWAGSSFNDEFTLSLNGTNLAKLSNGQAVTINNLANSPSGPFHPDYIDNPSGSAAHELDGYTKVLTFTGTTQVGLNELVIRIRDLGDGSYDSGVFLEAGSLGSVDPNAVPAPPGVFLALAGIATLGLGRFRLRRRMIAS